MNRRLLLGAFGCCVVVFVAVIASPSLHAQSVSGSLSGEAWSDTIGWICFSDTTFCPSSNVTLSIIDSSHATLSGYAWSDNVGWVSFNTGDLAGCPSGTCSASLVNGKLIGWARAYSQIGASDGWDGWISLDCTTAGTCGIASYGPAKSGGNTSGALSGYAWGGNVVGWINFSQVSAHFAGSIGTAFNPNFTATPARVQKGGTAYLSWDASASASSCSGVTDQNGTTVPGSAVLTASNLPATGINGPTTFTLTCTVSGASQSATASVTTVPVFQEI